MDRIFRNAAVVLILVNKHREVVDINRSGEIFSGKGRGEVLGLLGGQAINCINSTENGKPVCGKGKKCGTCELRSCIDNVFTKGETSYKKEGLMTVLNENDEADLCNVLISCSPIEVEGEKMALVTLDDITKQKNIEQELKEINKMKDKFFSIVAHDLKNPFNSILGYSELLMDMVEEDNVNEEQQIFVKYLHNSSKHAYSLLEDLLTWARMQMNRIPFKPEEVLMNEVIEKNIDLHTPAAHKKNITLEVESEKGYKVLADKFMVTTVLRNFISNAVKFSNNDGNIAVIVSQNSNDSVKIEVKDNGIGIPDSVIKKLFKIEENYSSSGTAGEKGTGLGLIICKEFIEKNKGQIGVESEFGKGSSFWFTLPISQ